MQIIPAFVTQNKCYQAGAPLTPRGIMLHSVGTPQPSAAVFARSFNQYQPGGVSVCVHAFAQADGTVYQTLPWEMRGWHCGGSANSTHIGVEMIEPSAGMTRSEAAEQIAGTYRTVVELFAELCKQYELDPAQDGVIIGHAEAGEELLHGLAQVGAVQEAGTGGKSHFRGLAETEARVPDWSRGKACRAIVRKAAGFPLPETIPAAVERFRSVKDDGAEIFIAGHICLRIGSDSSSSPPPSRGGQTRRGSPRTRRPPYPS